MHEKSPMFPRSHFSYAFLFPSFVCLPIRVFDRMSARFGANRAFLTECRAKLGDFRLICQNVEKTEIREVQKPAIGGNLGVGMLLALSLAMSRVSSHSLAEIFNPLHCKSGTSSAKA